MAACFLDFLVYCEHFVALATRENLLVVFEILGVPDCSTADSLIVLF